MRGTAWAGVQAVTEYCDWETKVGIKGWDANAYRQWRSMTDEKSVTKPKLAAVQAIREFAGV